MENDPKTRRDRPNRGNKTAGRPPELAENDENSADEAKRLHLLERRNHRWDRRNSHA